MVPFLAVESGITIRKTSRMFEWQLYINKDQMYAVRVFYALLRRGMADVAVEASFGHSCGLH